MQTGSKMAVVLLAAMAQLSPLAPVRAAAPASSPPVSLGNSLDRPGSIQFFGPRDAELFSEEVSNSLQGVLALNYVSRPEDGFPPGFLRASPPRQPWSATMWTRDSGAFLRELVCWGYYGHACRVANCLMNLAGTNHSGFISFPRYFAPGRPHESGTEMDGHAAIIIAMVSLWQRLPPADPFRARLYDFLHRPSSPVRYLHYVLEREPLAPGSGEFGGGGPKGLYDNVVQNNLCALALLSAAEMEQEAGDPSDARLWQRDARNLFQNMKRYLVGKDGAWIWCIDPKTLKPDPAVLQKRVNAGFGGLNGVASMTADVLGFNPGNWDPEILAHSWKTFDALYDVPVRREQFDQYGFWSQFNLIHDGLLTSPSYGQGYAIQAMLLFDKLGMAGRALDFLARATYEAPDVSFPHGRLSPYYFYERLYSPAAGGNGPLSSGCGPLNLVNVAEPLKIARLVAGVDDTSAAEVQIIPRLPPAWSGYRVENWPIRTPAGVVRADISFESKDGAPVFRLQVKDGRFIPALALRLPERNQTVWIHRAHVTEIEAGPDAKRPESAGGLGPNF